MRALKIASERSVNANDVTPRVRRALRPAPRFTFAKALKAMGLVIVGAVAATAAADIYRAVSSAAPVTFDFVVYADGDRYVLDHGMTRADCIIARENSVVPGACEAAK